MFKGTPTKDEEHAYEHDHKDEPPKVIKIKSAVAEETLESQTNELLEKVEKEVGQLMSCISVRYHKSLQAIERLEKENI